MSGSVNFALTSSGLYHHLSALQVTSASGADRLPEARPVSRERVSASVCDSLRTFCLFL